ncbi:hypothetical protein AVEN_148864-1 [Araneus ventricosus]|uniref:Uncharacterized protein n=1 Tax=Araneus ventricosus TaxID=182803 RepID=A0A4Y2SUS6_ARAVE|nr:hypothetical protein AVEN_148864-1 [Araneus ventricosus]
MTSDLGEKCGGKSKGSRKWKNYGPIPPVNRDIEIFHVTSRLVGKLYIPEALKQVFGVTERCSLCCYCYLISDFLPACVANFNKCYVVCYLCPVFSGIFLEYSRKKRRFHYPDCWATFIVTVLKRESDGI